MTVYSWKVNKNVLTTIYPWNITNKMFWLQSAYKKMATTTTKRKKLNKNILITKQETKTF